MSSSLSTCREYERDRLPFAFLAAILVSSAFALVFGALVRPVAPPPPPPPVRIALVQMPTPAPPPPPPPVASAPFPLPPVAPPPIPRQPNGTLATPPTRPVRNVAPRRPPLHRHRAPTVPHREQATATPTPPVPAPESRSLQRPAGDPAARDALTGRIKQAIQAVFRYPEAARDMGAHGTVLVGFLYRDRTIFNVRVLRSSASPILDRAAVEIVRAADPPPPGTLAGQTLSLETPVVFDIVTDDD